ncbi:dihydrolipoamide acetyltransferase family protein [Capillimicrobium parvum]|uniref:Dihydrolipoamide acetyltransferase component of pyruvate dehydrogenase complex n=1 Tax=Capillimicrobium parvum TaxID=2884022 RepID=A0A9E6XW80_9ACTN|nr:dihydrolipoamide acetyltransferase family protein [Capillimicrobium parvum]UGS35584.1 Dihydrolipoyllysine-residue acetyltransferase component of pyruvate dehydrogenase complex [Capillimicrobium parvum]
MPEVVMPRLSDSMEEGTILRWLKADGDTVNRGEEIVEIETDKATMPYEADTDGALHIVAAEGTTLPIGAVIATIGTTAEPAAANGSATAPETETAGESAGQAAEPAPAPAQAPAAPAQAPAAPASAGAGVGVGVGVGAPAAAPGNGGDRVKASPLARRIARERDIDLHALTGTGPDGRIVKSDVLAAAHAPASAPAPAETPTPTPEPAPPETPATAPEPATTAGTKGDVDIHELTRLQQVVARRMAESKATIPDFSIATDVDMAAARALRTQLKDAARTDQPVPSFNDMVVKASALALREFPHANGSYRDGHYELHTRINIGVAVAGQDALVVPTVFDADTKSLGDIARTTRGLAERVRDNTIRPPQLAGGTFTVSNLGMYGITHFTAVINPPQAAILAVGAITQQPVIRNDQITTGHLMTITLTCDHRILYGADAAQFLARIRHLLENPLTLAF